METITTESFTFGGLLLYAIGRVNAQQIFDRDHYESRRTAMKGSRLLNALVFYQLLAAPSARGAVDAIEDSLDAQAALEEAVARNSLSNALSQRELEQMIEAWMFLLGYYSPCLRMRYRQLTSYSKRPKRYLKGKLDGYLRVHFHMGHN